MVQIVIIVKQPVYSSKIVEILLENRLLTLITFNFQHRLLTDVETIDVNIINVNIGFLKTDVNIHYTTSVIYEN